MSDSLRTTLVLVGLGPAAIAVVTAPSPALLVVTGLGVLVGFSAGAGVSFVRGDAAHAGSIGIAAAGAAIESGLALAGVLVTLGPASVVGLPALFLMVGTAWWVDSPDRIKAMIGLEAKRDHLVAQHSRPPRGSTSATRTHILPNSARSLSRSSSRTRTQRLESFYNRLRKCQVGSGRHRADGPVAVYVVPDSRNERNTNR